MKTYKTIFDRIDSAENVHDGSDSKPAFDFYKSIKKHTTLNYRDFLSMTDDEDKLKIIMSADFLGHDLKYFSGSFSKERLKETFDFFNRGYMIPKKVANCKNDDIFIILLKLIKLGVDFNIYSYENYSLHFLRELLVLVRKKPQDFNINLWYTLEKLFTALNYFDSSLLALQNNPELIKSFGVKDLINYLKRHTDSVTDSGNKQITFDIS